MAFEHKVQKIVLEMSAGKNIKAIKDELVNIVKQELHEKHDQIVIESLERWKQHTLKPTIIQVLKTMPKSELKALLE